MSPRITLVSDTETWGGADVHLTALLRRLPALGWSVRLVCAEPLAAEHAAHDPLVVPLARHTAEAPAMRAAIGATAPDVVLVNLVDPGSNAAAVTAAQSVAPTVGVLHLVGDTGTGPRREELVALYAGFALLLTPATEIRDQIVTDLRVPADRVHVVPNGVDVPAVAAGPAGNPVPRVGTFGRLTPQKGFDLLLTAIRELVDEGVELDVVIGGAGREEASLRAAAAGLPVTFPGFVDDAYAFLRQLDVFCLSSRREALPLVLLEAMAAGLPCVSTAVGDVRTAVGDDAVVVPVEDPEALATALRDLLADPGRRAALGQRARERAVREFDADLMARRFSAVLTTAAAAAGGLAG
ncbi:glycosyltransferase family 4 protein [Blastococcus sp. TF02A-26]|uniref:glycosyltransferase family 4 protein n=1 Tax=Blastococcus sp. TF02A-26 TaxID=2250577 RepID=UPI000DE9C6B9|nr:glycosyltransferase family 4 protein [Blastococcus sp. TF02A-26]RBY83284.1 glycosyltransferase [Blastococcus sp. TF02A-26]